MNKLLIALILSFFISPSAIKAQPECLRDTLTEFDFVNGSAQKIKTGRRIYTYNPNGEQIERVTQKFQNNIWLNIERSFTSYDSLGNRTELWFQDWHNNAWLNSNKILYQINAQGNVTLVMRKNWNAANSNWQDSIRDTYVYNNNRQTSFLQESYNATTA